MSDMVDTMDTWLQGRMEEIHTSMPGRIQTYNPSTRTATVVPSVRLRSMHGDLLEVKPIQGVPVVWPSSAQFALIPAKLEPGDGVLLHFTEVGIGNWISGKSTMDADDETRFSLQDCIASPGLFQPKNLKPQDLKGADYGLVGTKGEVIGGKDGKVSIKNTETDLRAVLESMQTMLSIMDVHHTALNAFAPGYPTQVTNLTSMLANIKGLLA
jgi:hypothetical protein